MTELILITYLNFVPLTDYSFGPGTVLGPGSYIKRTQCEIVEVEMDSKGNLYVTCEVIK